MTGGSMGGGTTGSAVGNQPCDNPNGCPGGPTSLSGTGSSQFGGSSPGAPAKDSIKTERRISRVFRGAHIKAAPTALRRWGRNRDGNALLSGVYAEIAGLQAADSDIAQGGGVVAIGA